MTTDWTLHAIIGTTDLSETLFVGSAAPDDPDPVVLPKLVAANWRHQLVEDGSWPAIQDVSTGSVSIMFATAEEATDFGAGRPVYLRLLHPTADTTPVSTFSGRISNPDLVPHRLGVLATFPLTDYLADLREETSGEDDYPAGVDQYDQLVGLFTEVGLNPPERPGAPDFAYGLLRGRDPEPASLLTLAQETVAAALILSPDDEHLLYELRPNLDGFGGLDLVEPWVLAPLPRQAVESDGTLAAGTIVAGGKWTRTLFSDTNTVHILAGDKVVARANNRGPGDPAVTLRRSSQALSGAATADLAEYLLPDPEWVPGWEAEEFTIPLRKLAADEWPGQLRDVLTVTDIPVQHNPNGTTEWTGVLTALEVRVAEGKAHVGVNLSDRPRVEPPPPPPDPITFADYVDSLDPIWWYRFDETSGAVCNDSSGNGLHGSYVPTGGSFAYAQTGFVPGDPSKCVQLTPTAVIGGSAHSALNNVPQASVHGVFSTTQTGVVYLINRFTGSDFTLIIDFQSSNVIRFIAVISGTQRTLSVAVPGMRDGNPHDVVMTYDGTTLRGYVDGVQVTSGAWTGALSTTSTATWRIGGRSDTNTARLSGKVDECFYVGRALTADEVANLHTARVVGEFTPTP